MEVSMAVMTIRNIDDSLKHRLRLRAAQHGRSMEEEVRDILRSVLSAEVSQEVDAGQAIHQRFARLGGVDLPPVSREAIRDVDFGM
ncbi:plasmid stabilization protein [Acetobacter pomorum]|nr:plasmid stabilization protein [Acetobacter oryzifermentans]ATI13628.1 plasmid stabilization protein [Acetobacter pomorum]AXC27925.1 plasmid stabilization protein [Acetobacter sp. JWB]KAA8420818.1 plasmid stabilization protein [Acetobacter pomorum]KAA8435433.1 plasmid stabilization protein [Acetobacter pomorum]